ncbi:unnamed protein product [Symbiodinium microadriaticum]|nr:unnamed protein product [Symbiodinium microadriaticum]
MAGKKPVQKSAAKATGAKAPGKQEGILVKQEPNATTGYGRFVLPCTETAVFQTDERGVPISDGDILCMNTVRRLFPHLTMKEAGALINSPPADDPNLKKNFMRAREAVKIEMENQLLPTFTPSSSVTAVNMFGHEIYEKCALMTAEQVAKTFGKSPQQLGMEVFSTPNLSASQEHNYYPISLDGLPEGLRGLRRCKVYFSRHCSHAENWLTPETQLIKGQGVNVFDYVFNSKYSNTRPAKVATQNVQTFSHWEEVAQKLENAMASALAQAKEQRSGLEAAEVPVDEEAVQQSRQAMEAMEGFGDGFELEAAAKRKRRKLDNKAAAAAASAQAAAGSNSRGGSKLPPQMPTPAAAITDEDADMKSVSQRSGTKKDQEQEALLRSLDPDMRKVALAHLSGKVTSSAKSLIHLNVKTFLDKAQRILDGLNQSRPDSDEFEKLAVRVKQCKAAHAVVNCNDLGTVSTAELRDCIATLEPYWAEMPAVLQVDVNNAITKGLLSDLQEMQPKDTAVGEAGVDLAEKIVLSQIPRKDPGQWSGETFLQGAIMESCVSQVESLLQEIASGFAGPSASEELEGLAKKSTTVLQATGEAMIAVLNGDAFRKMFRSPEVYKTNLQLLATAYLKHMASARAMVDAWKDRDSEDLLQPGFDTLLQCLERVEKVMRFVSHVWSFKGPWETSSKDVVDLLNSKGDNLERSLANIASKEPAWKAAIDDVVRTATTSRTLEPLKQRVKATLEESKLTYGSMNTVLDEFEKLQAGVRSADLEEITSLLSKKILKISQGILSKEPEQLLSLSLKEEELRTLIRGLEIFRLLPGMQDQCEELKRWATEHGQLLMKNDFLAFAELSSKNGIADMAAFESIMKRCGSDMTLPKTVETGVRVTGLAVSALVGLVAEVKANKGALQQLHITGRVGLIKKVLALYYPPEHTLFECVQLHTDVLKAGVAFSNVLNKLPNSLTNKHAAKDMGAEKTRTLLLSVLSRCDAMNKSMNILAERVKQEESVREAEAAASGDGAAAAEAEFLNTHQASMWDVNTRDFLVPLMTDENLMDCVARACVYFKDTLCGLREKLEKGLGAAMGDKSWRHHFQGRAIGDLSLEEILQTASTSLLTVTLKGNALRTELANCIKEMDQATTFQDAVSTVSSWESGVVEAIESLGEEIQSSQVVIKESHALFNEMVFVLALQMPRDKAEDAQTIVNQQWTKLLAETGGCSSDDIFPPLEKYVREFMAENVPAPAPET